MNRIRHWLGHSLIVAAAAGVAGCAGDTPVGPDRGPAAAAVSRDPDLGGCGDLRAPAGNGLFSRLYAEGDQIYRWDGVTWVFVAPSAQLFADPNGGKGKVGTHYAGPTWESTSGSKVVGTVLKRCTPNASAIQWLLLGAVSSDGPGMFRGTTFIQRINTVGGLAPVQAGSFIGETANVPYSTEYLFYRAQ